MKYKIYICNKCGYKTNRKSSYLQHTTRKTPCDKNIKKNNTFINNKTEIVVKNTINNTKNTINNKIKCNYCLKTFSCQTSIYRHKKTCKKKKEFELEKEIKKLRYEKEKYKLEKEIVEKELKEKIKDSKKKDNTINILVKFELNKDLINKLMTNKTFITKSNKILIKEIKELRISVEKHKTMNMWGCSKVQLEWLKVKSIIDNTYIISKSNSGKEHSIKYNINKNKKTRVDGFSKELNKIYEFQGDYWHGNPQIYKPEKYNKKCKKTFGELYTNTVNRTKLLEKQGYTYS